MINYFKHFGLPVRLNLNQAELRKLYYHNSRKYHPDFFTLENNAKQDEVLRLSTLNNEAYNVLKDDDKGQLQGKNLPVGGGVVALVVPGMDKMNNDNAD